MALVRRVQATAYPELQSRGNAQQLTPEDMKRLIYAKPPQRERWRTRYGRSLNLDRIESAIRGAQDGYMRDITDLARETVSVDPHLASVLNKRIGAVASLPYEIVPADVPDEYKARAQQNADFVRKQIDRIPRFRQALKQLAWGLFDGRSALEVQWLARSSAQQFGTLRDRGETVEWIATELAWIHPRRLQFGPERELRISDDITTYGFAEVGIALRDLPFKFVEFRPQLFGDYPELEGLAPRCLYWSFFKRFGARERMILLELFGKPWRIVEVDGESDTSPQDLEDAKNAADALGSSNTARMPRGTKLNVVSPGKAAGEVHADVIGESDKQISKLVLGQTGTTDPMAGGLNGQQSLVMQNEQMLILTSDAELLSEAVEDGLTDSIIALNFGSEELDFAPKFVLRAELPTDRSAEGARLKSALDAGLRVSAKEAYEVIGFREPGEDEAFIQIEDVVGPMGAAVARPVLNPGASDEEIERGADAIGSVLETVSAPEAKAPEAPKLVVPPEEMIKYVSVNEIREAQGRGPLLLPDGTPDPDGNLTKIEFDALKQAKAASMKSPTVEQVPTSEPEQAVEPVDDEDEIEPDEVGELPDSPQEQVKDKAEDAAEDALGALIANASGALLERVYSDARGLPVVHTHGGRACHVTLAKNRQPDTVHGTLEEIIERGVAEGGRVAQRWADAIGDAVAGKTTASQINAALNKAVEKLDLLQFARAIERRITHSMMTGALDSQWEAETDETIAPEAFAEPEKAQASRVNLAGKPPDGSDVRNVSPAFTRKAYKDALKYFNEKKPISKSIFEKLSAAAKARAFTVAGLASEHSLNIAKSELKNAIVRGDDLKDFRSKLAQRFEKAGFSKLNPSHVETVFRTNILDSYNLGRRAEMSQPESIKVRPYWLIRTVRDGRQRETHGAVNSWVLRADDPFWVKVGGPPWGYNCRCRVTSIRAKKAEGMTVRSGVEIRGIPDEGFTPNALVPPSLEDLTNA